jgi:hypothetical protein
LTTVRLVSSSTENSRLLAWAWGVLFSLDRASLICSSLGAASGALTALAVSTGAAGARVAPWAVLASAPTVPRSVARAVPALAMVSIVLIVPL